MASQENDPLVPWGYGGRKIRLSEIPNDPLFKGLEPKFAANVLKLITENPTIGIGGSDRTPKDVLRLWKERYSPTNEKLDILDPKIYKAFGAGRYKEYQGQIYKLNPNMDPAATPNASWHTGGYAVDFIGDTDLAGKLADKYNIRKVDTTGEKWHFQPKGLPDGRRVLEFLKNNYGIDINQTPISDEALNYINNNFSSNAPVHPQEVLNMIGQLVGRPNNAGVRKKLQKMDEKLSPKKRSVPANGRFSPHSNIMPRRLGGY
jgi:hypothetical protein